LLFFMRHSILAIPMLKSALSGRRKQPEMLTLP